MAPDRGRWSGLRFPARDACGRVERRSGGYSDGRSHFSKNRISCCA